MKKVLVRILGWLLLFFGCVWTASGVGSAFIMLTVDDPTFEFWGRIFSFLLCIAFAVGCAALVRLGYKLKSYDPEAKKGEKKTDPAAASKQESAPEPEKEPAPAAVSKPVRSKALKGLPEMTLYTLNTQMNMLPLCKETTLYLFTDKTRAEEACSKSEMREFLRLHEIIPEKLPEAMLEYWACGYEKAVVDMGAEVELKEIYPDLKEASMGSVLPKTRNAMILFNQTRAINILKANRDQRRMTEQEVTRLNLLGSAIFLDLQRSSLLLPTEKVDGKVRIVTPVAKFPDGSKWLAVFTDWAAVCAYITSPNVGSIVLPGLIQDQAKTVAENPELMGVLVNPGREEFRLTRENLMSILQGSLDELLKKCESLHKADPKSADIPPLKEKIVAKVKQLDALYVAYDLDFNNRFPFIDTMGRMEFYTRHDRAENGKAFFESHNEGRFEIRKIPKAQFEQFFEDLSCNSYTMIRLDNGFAPVELEVSMFSDSKLPCVVDRSNAGIRYLLIRDLQYAYRLKKLDASLKGSKKEHVLTEMMLTMQANAYQTLAKGLIYVFGPGPHRPGTTLYTPKALARAKDLLQEYKLEESALVAPGDSGVEEYTGSLNLRVTMKHSGQSMAESFCCAFTERKSAEEVHVAFARSGCDDCVIVVTFEELMGQAVQCAGIVLDMPTYGLEIPKEEFGKIQMYGQIPGGIVVNLKDKQEETQS